MAQPQLNASVKIFPITDLRQKRKREINAANVSSRCHHHQEQRIAVCLGNTPMAFPLMTLFSKPEPVGHGSRPGNRCHQRSQGLLAESIMAH